MATSATRPSELHDPKNRDSNTERHFCRCYASFYSEVIIGRRHRFPFGQVLPLLDRYGVSSQKISGCSSQVVQSLILSSKIRHIEVILVAKRNPMMSDFFRGKDGFWGLKVAVTFQREVSYFFFLLGFPYSLSKNF